MLIYVCSSSIACSLVYGFFFLMFDDLCLFRRTPLFFGEMAFERLCITNMRSYSLKVQKLETMSDSRLCDEK